MSNLYVLVSENLLKYAKDFGFTLGYDCRRLLLRDVLFSSSSNDICAYDVCAAVLQPFIIDNVVTRGHKRKSVQRCSHCFKRRRRLPMKRCCVISAESEGNINEVIQPFLNHYDFSAPALDCNGNWTVSISGFSSPTPPGFGMFSTYQFIRFFVWQLSTCNQLFRMILVAAGSSF